MKRVHEGAFVVGSARCGSTLVSDLLRLHPDLLSLSEVFAMAGASAFRPARPTGRRFWHALSRPSRALSLIGNPDVAPREFLYGRVTDPAHDPWLCPPILTIALPHLVAQPDALFGQLAAAVRARGRMPLADHYRALFSDLGDHLGRRIWVERSGGSLGVTATLREMFPRARFVLLLRDGAETALSMRDYPAAQVAMRLWQGGRRVGLDLLHPRRHFGRGAIWAALQRAGDTLPIGRAILRQPDLELAGRFWSALTIAGLNGLRGLPPGQLMVLRYETLVADPRTQLIRLGAFLAGNAPATWLDQAARLPQARPSRLAALPASQAQKLRADCAEGEAAITDFLSARGADQSCMPSVEAKNIA